MSEGLSRQHQEGQALGKKLPGSDTGRVYPPAFSNPDVLPRFTYGPGDQPLAGYTIKRGIGQGGFGEVYYAWSDAGKEVALKCIRRHLEIELRGLRQCLNLKHPNLVSLYDIRQDAQQNYWVIMEYVGGVSLHERIACCASGLPPAEVLQWMEGICAGVEYLHEHGVVHRDLKPANIFCEQGIVKIGDYGLSKWMVSGQRSGQTENVGTVHYMAPEVGGGRYGKEIDIYALGVILYEMLTGRPPFEGQTAAEVLMKHLTAQPDLAKVPEPFRPIVSRALAKDPAHRFASAGQMWQALVGLRGRRQADQGGLSAEAIPGPITPAALLRQNPEWTALARPEDARPTTAPGLLDDRRLGWGAQTFRLVAAAGAAVANPEVRNILWQLAVALWGTWVFLAVGSLLVPLAALGMIGYGLYAIRRSLLGLAWAKQFLPGRRGDNPMSIEPGVEGRSTLGALPRPPASPYEQAAKALREKPLLVRLTELLGSLLIAALVTCSMCGVIMAVYGIRHGGEMIAWEQMAWLAVMSTAGAWAVLTAAKFWEGSEGEALLRRLVLLGVGLALGLLGYGLSEWLWVQWASLKNFPRPPGHPLPGPFYGAGGEPLLGAFLTNFAVLMALIRWQRQADPLRFARLNLWSVLVCVSAAALTAWVLRFPQPWLPMWAGLMSLAVQLAAPWAHPRRRHLR